MTTGMIRPFCDAVLALKFLQKSMMLTPCWPKAGPTGGAGVASPAGIWSLTYAVIFLAITLAFHCLRFELQFRNANFEFRIWWPLFSLQSAWSGSRKFAIRNPKFEIF